MILPVIMAGGSGSRLWPLSRKLQPKQFLSLVGEQSMLQETVARLQGLACDDPLIICGEDHRFTVAEQLRENNVDNKGILLEPAGRNTAPAIALAALEAIKGGNDPLLLVLAADHVITNVPAFQKAILQAQALAESEPELESESEKLVTFGIVPSKAETGYGYIKKGAALGEGFEVAAFVEKPNQATAEQYLASGDYVWNSGLFLFKASVYLKALGEFQPQILSACETAMQHSARDIDFIRPQADAFLSSPDDSIDYAVMEKANNVAMVPMDCGWSDVGSWSALWDVSNKDDNGNTVRGEVLLEQTENCYVRSHDDKIIATVGLQNIVIVDTADALLVAAKDKVQDVKKIVETLKSNDCEIKQAKVENHRKVYRPWGYYDSIDAGERFQVKRIVVYPNAHLSLQMHHHRAEHWIVVSGTALVTKGDEEFLVGENQSTYIPLGVTHRLHNPGSIALEMIEVQSGSYLGEDDIVRFDDIYGRSKPKK
jgi:mannose-1-phosphate guanylyltransferase/mannose-6-phosphate isomerase